MKALGYEMMAYLVLEVDETNYFVIVVDLTVDCSHSDQLFT
jgi:hypothetical protein